MLPTAIRASTPTICVLTRTKLRTGRGYSNHMWLIHRTTRSAAVGGWLPLRLASPIATELSAAVLAIPRLESLVASARAC